MQGIKLTIEYSSFVVLLKAEELTLTVGQAFDLAYRRFLEKKAVNQNSNKKLTEMEEKIKTAEEEKEALKQKIAELEVAARQGPPSSNGSNEVNLVRTINFAFLITVSIVKLRGDDDKNIHQCLKEFDPETSVTSYMYVL